MKINPNFPYDVYNFIIKPLRDADNFGILERFTGASQEGFETIQANIASLDDLRVISAIPDVYLEYVYPIIGWTSELSSITDRLSDSDKRRLLLMSASIWKQKSTEKGIGDMIRAFTGKDAIAYDFFDFRSPVDIAIVDSESRDGNDSHLTGGEGRLLDVNPVTFAYNDGRDVTYVYLTDENNNVDTQLVSDVLYLNRPPDEVFYLLSPNLMEDFHLGVSKLTSYDTSYQAVWDSTNLVASLPANGDNSINVDTSAWKEYTISITATFKSSSNYFEIITHGTVDSAGTLTDGYISKFMGNGSIELHKVVSSSSSLLASYAPTNTSAGIGGVAPDDALDSRFVLSVKVTIPSVSDVKLTLSKDANNRIEHTDTHPVPIGTDIRIRNGNAAELDNVVAYRHVQQDFTNRSIKTVAVVDRSPKGGVRVPMLNRSLAASVTPTNFTASDGSVIKLVPPMTDSHRSDSLTSGINVDTMYGLANFSAKYVENKVLVEISNSGWTAATTNTYDSSVPVYTSIWHVSTHRSISPTSLSWTSGESAYRTAGDSGWGSDLQGEAVKTVIIGTSYSSYTTEYKLHIVFNYLAQFSVGSGSPAFSGYARLVLYVKTSNGSWVSAATYTINSSSATENDLWQKAVIDCSSVSVSGLSIHSATDLSTDLLKQGSTELRFHFESATAAPATGDGDTGLYIDNIQIQIGS